MLIIEKLIKKIQEEAQAPVKKEEPETKDDSFIYKSLEEKLKQIITLIIRIILWLQRNMKRFLQVQILTN